jgi:cytochrome c oxidase subunit 2
VTPPAPPPPEVKEINVTAKQWEFTPSSITVKKGQSIRLRITSQDVTHGFSLLDFGINEQLTPGGTVEIQFIPDKAGSFTFRCSVFCGSGHGGMKGTLVVTE